MAIKTLTVTREICENGDWNVSNLRVQKILYLAHKVFLGRNDRTPLIHDDFQAWDYGPVVPTVYHEFKMFGAGTVKKLLWVRETSCLDKESKEGRFIKEACDSLSKLEDWELVAMTHRKGGAWAKHYTGAKGVVIPNDSIYEEYQKEQRERQETKNK